MKNFDISVLIPVYKTEHYIERCLRSLFEQTIAEKAEFILVNDCTPDASIERATTLIAEYPGLKDQIRILHHESNRGLAAARNTALTAALGRYIINVDSDDWVEPQYLQKLYTAIEEAGADIAMCNYIDEYESSSVQSVIIMPKDGRDCLRALLQRKLPGVLWNKLICRSLFEYHKLTSIEGIDMGEDDLMSSKLFFFSKKQVLVPTPLYHYECRRDQSLTATTVSEVQVTQRIVANHEIEAFFKKQAAYDQYKTDLRIKKIHTIRWIVSKGTQESYALTAQYAHEKLWHTRGVPLGTKIIIYLCTLRLFKAARAVLRVLAVVESLPYKMKSLKTRFTGR